MTDIVDRLKNYRYSLPSGKAVQPDVCVIAAAEIERLRIALDDANQSIVDLTEAALECASDLESDIEARYSNGIKEYPSMVRKYERDMVPVMLVRKLTLPHLVRRQAKASRRIGDHIMTFSLLKKILLITFMISISIFLALNNIKI